jgi:hypothetical protein
MNYGAAMKNQMNFMSLQKLAADCGLPADTVKLTPPALTTCEGAIVKSMSVERCLRTCMHAKRMSCVER